MSTPSELMQRALDLAILGQGDVEPNPMVGAVIVRDGQIIGEGYHQKFGGPHAEVNAIGDCRARGHDPAGATMYVTLEPCSHTGKTPPCADALIAAQIAEVVVAMVDPFPAVSGRGVERLRAAGINVTIGDGEAAARDLNAPFIKRVTTGLPWTILKWAQTIDGKVATATGDSKWISGQASRRRVHDLRARVDAVMVGIGTALADDPQLTARDVQIRRHARRVVVDPALQLPPSSQLLQQAKEQGGLTLAASEQAISDTRRAKPLLDAGAELLPLPQRPEFHHLNLEPLLRHLAQQHQATNILIEGGPRLAGSLLQQHLVDEAWIFIAPKIFGDPTAKSAIAGFSAQRITEALQTNLRQVEQLAPDILLRLRLDPNPETRDPRP